MSLEAVRWALQQAIPSPSQKLVLVALAEKATRDGVCQITQGDLAKTASVDERTVRRHLSDLEASGKVKIKHCLRKKRGRAPDEYHLQIASKQADIRHVHPGTVSGRKVRQMSGRTSVHPDTVPGRTSPEAKNGVHPDTVPGRTTPVHPGMVSGRTPARMVQIEASVLPTVERKELLTTSVDDKSSTGNPPSVEKNLSDCQRLVNRVIELGLAGQRISDYAKQASRAKQLLEEQSLEWWLETAEMMCLLFPYSTGDPWDVFALGKRGNLARAKANGGSQQKPVEEDLPEWERNVI